MSHRNVQDIPCTWSICEIKYEEKKKKRGGFVDIDLISNLNKLLIKTCPGTCTIASNSKKKTKNETMKVALERTWRKGKEGVWGVVA